MDRIYGEAQLTAVAWMYGPDANHPADIEFVSVVYAEDGRVVAELEGQRMEVRVAPDAYESATGDDFPADSSDLSGSPRGASWDDESQDALVQRYPALAARFR